MSRLFIGIDPGASGGMAALYDDGSRWVLPTPATETDIWNWFSTLPASPKDVFAVIEKVGGYVAGNPTPGSAMFRFGRNVGVLIGCLIAAEIPFEEVTPQKWMREFSISRRKGESKTGFKNRLKSVAQSLFPQEKVTLATCDALLIAEFTRRKHS